MKLNSLHFQYFRCWCISQIIGVCTAYRILIQFQFQYDNSATYKNSICSRYIPLYSTLFVQSLPRSISFCLYSFGEYIPGVLHFNYDVARDDIADKFQTNLHATTEIIVLDLSSID